MKTMKNFKLNTWGAIEYESEVNGFKSGGAYIPASRQYVGRKVIVKVLPDDKKEL